MKKFLILIMVLLTVFTFGTKEILLVTGEWAPFVSQSLPNYGFHAEIITAAFKESGYIVKYEFYPWTRCEKMIEKGTVWGTFPYVKTPERIKKYLFTEAFGVGDNKFFYYSGNNVILPDIYNKLSDLKDYKIGGILGYSYIEDFKNNNITLDLSKDVESNIKKLRTGRIDLFIEDEFVAKNIIKKLFPDEVNNFRTLTKSYTSYEDFIMVSKTFKNSGQIIKDFNSGLKKIKNNGIYSSILKKYGL